MRNASALSGLVLLAAYAAVAQDGEFSFEIVDAEVKTEDQAAYDECRRHLSREAYAGAQLESLADKLTGGSLAPLITHLLVENKLSSAEISRLRRLLDEGPA